MEKEQVKPMDNGNIPQESANSDIIFPQPDNRVEHTKTSLVRNRWQKYQELVKKNEELFKLYQELAAKKSEIESMMTDIEKQMQSNMDEMRK